MGDLEWLDLIIQMIDQPNGMDFPKVRRGRYLWTPAPAAGQFAIEQLRKARHRRQESLHVVAIPRLFTAIWRKQLYKVSDMVFEIPAGALPQWGENQYEPLTVAVLFPFVSSRPWQLKGSPRIVALERKLSQVWKYNPTRARDLLRKLRDTSATLETMPESLVWKVLSSESDCPIFRESTTG